MRPHIVSSINEGVLVGATLAVLFAITCLAVWLVAFLLRRRFKRLSLPVSLVLSHSLLLLVCVALYPTGIFFGKPPVDDLYGGFFLFPGPHLYLLAGKFFVEPLLPLLSPLLDHIHAHTSAGIAILHVP